MTPLNVIGIFFIIQLLVYFILDKTNLKNWKFLILSLFLIGYIFVLPNYFISDNPTNEPRCGMPAIGITLVFWIFGCTSTLLTHFTYYIISEINSNKKATKKILQNGRENG
jgi:cell division protein FtsW (lipid II flippase)